MRYVEINYGTGIFELFKIFYFVLLFLDLLNIALIVVHFGNINIFYFLFLTFFLF